MGPWPLQYWWILTYRYGGYTLGPSNSSSYSTETSILLLFVQALVGFDVPVLAYSPDILVIGFFTIWKL